MGRFVPQFGPLSLAQGLQELVEAGGSRDHLSEANCQLENFCPSCAMQGAEVGPAPARTLKAMESGWEA